MKKLLGILGAAGLVVSTSAVLVSCGGGDTTSNEILTKAANINEAANKIFTSTNFGNGERVAKDTKVGDFIENLSTNTNFFKRANEDFERIYNDNNLQDVVEGLNLSDAKAAFNDFIVKNSKLVVREFDDKEVANVGESTDLTNKTDSLDEFYKANTKDADWANKNYTLAIIIAKNATDGNFQLDIPEDIYVSIGFSK